ncbi:MAG: zinc metallopeptidase, partial [Treponema sp.]|nr:zinc metallopeptidase [Treponema sp.]
VAARLMRAEGVRDIAIGKTKGELTDHYHPTHRIVNLSDSTYGNASVAAGVLLYAVLNARRG